MRHIHRITALAALGGLALQGCDQNPPLAPPELASAKKLDADVCAFGREFTLESTNLWFPIEPGTERLYEGEEEGALVELRVSTLEQTEVVGNVTTRVVREVEHHDGELIEISHNFFATAADGTVCYFGEAVDIYEGGQIVSHEGAWRADEPGHLAGIIMPADPQPGTKFAMERAPGIAEDAGKIIGSGPVTVPAGTFDETIRVREFNPLDRGVGYKTFANGVGLVIDGPVQLVSITNPASQ
jgi:hypothetical protein